MNIVKTSFACFWLVLLPLLVGAQEFRTIDGVGNNAVNPEWGAAGGPLFQYVPPGFADGVSSPARSQVMNAREISNILFEQDELIFDSHGLSDFIWAFGQFLDHDITLVHNHAEAEWMTEGFPIVIPDDDVYMTPGKIIPLMRSKEMDGSGNGPGNPRRYANDITAYIDGSAVYGSDEDRASWLRTFEGGKLKMSKGGRLPWNTVDGEFNSAIDPEAPVMEDAVGLSKKLFVAGDLRANENPLLLSVHTLFVREHNRLCDELLNSDPGLDPSDPDTEEWLYQTARRIVGAIIQRITYEEWLPAIGVKVPEYTGYDPNIDPSISNIFSAAAFRWGHTAINERVLRFNVDGSVSDHGHIELHEAFFNPIESLRLPLEVYFKGMGIQNQQDVDCKLVGSLRNFLFNNNPVLGGLDLAAINIQRGRERGLPDYNTVRESLGLDRKEEFIEICIDETQAQVLEAVYGDIDQLDPWVGMLAEDHLPGSKFGELINVIMGDQFDALRTGDRYYYEHDLHLSDSYLTIVNGSSFSEVIKRNTDIECFQDDVFVATAHEDIPCWPYVAPVNLDIAMSPNPVTDRSFLSIHSARKITGNIRIVNSVGQTVYEKDCQLDPGHNRISLDWQDILVEGHFYVLVESGDDLSALKVTKL